MFIYLVVALMLITYTMIIAHYTTESVFEKDSNMK